jgi:hypothetical protein
MAHWRFGRAMRESRPSLSRSAAHRLAASLSLSPATAHVVPLARGYARFAVEFVVVQVVQNAVVLREV